VYSDMMFIVYVTCSVPQGTVLGPLFFNLNMADLADQVAKYGVSLHAYADDTAVSPSVVKKLRHPSTNLSAVSWT